MTEEAKQEKAPETSEAPKVDLVKLIEDQRKKVETLEKAAGEEAEDSPSTELNRERDLLRHYLLVQKGSPKERATAKAQYASKAALSRAIQPVENDPDL